VDLTAEITLDPPVPDPGQVSTIRVVVKNRGTSNAATGFYVYLYVDPPDRPPNLGTPDTYLWYLPGLRAGMSSSLERTHTFATTGCDHVVYVWVDRDNRVGEENETNNLVSAIVCVGVACQPDAYEDDDSCATAGWGSSGATQSRTLCPVGDQDWVKFTALGGVTYVISATNLGAHADPLLYLYPTCGSLAQFGTGPRIDWVAPASGVYYVQIRHRQETYGPLAGYDLGIAATGGPADVYEPDDNCATARDIRTDGTRQTHLFQAVGDQDWVKFTVNSGETFSIVADNVGAGVSPLVSLYSSCDQALQTSCNSGNSWLKTVLAQGSQVQATAQTGQTYYAQVVNQNPNVYGPAARYDLAVRVIPCVADAFEDDDRAATAREILTTGATQTHNTCPSGDEDWVRFTAEAGTIYVLQTSNLGLAADTVLHLYDTDGVTELAHNDDYGYLLASRIIWQCSRDGIYYAKVHHHNPNASGADTRYDLSIAKGRCTPDAYEPDNGALDARPLTTDGQPQDHNFCPDARLSGVGDQDWVRFAAVAGATYLIQAANLGLDSDTVLELYDRNGVTLLAANDDHGPGQASAISFTAPSVGTYYVRARHYNSAHFGSETDYQLAITTADHRPPTATPTPSPTASPTPTPSPTPAPPPSQVKTLILVNRQRIASLYSAADAAALTNKLYELANHDRVQGAVIQVEDDVAVATAYSQWTADQASLLDTAKANAVAGAVRNLVMQFHVNNLNVEYILIIGDDRVIPYRRVPEGNLNKTEHEYAPSVTANTTLWAAAQDNMTLTDDYYADLEPTQWQGHELYIPDYAVGRLVERPDEIIAFIDSFLTGHVVVANRVLVTGYDFVMDAGSAISSLFKNDGIATDDALIGTSWSGDALRAKLLDANPRFDVQSINGHASHTTVGTPDQDDIQAGEVVTATSDLARALVFSVGCHSGFNDSGSLDLVQAFAQKKANYVGNTGFGWGGSGVVYSEALMKNYARELLRGTSAKIGKALTAAKQLYYQRALLFTPYDEKVLMEATFYGLPMVEITSGEVLGPEDPFPSVMITSTTPSPFGGVNVGRLDYGLIGSFGAFDQTSTQDGTFLALNNSVYFNAGEPIQPRFFATLSAPPAGPLHGAIFLGGVYTDVLAFDPVIALPFNEYITSTAEPAFSAPGWYPAVPFQVRTSGTVSTTAGTVVTLLGQYNSAAGVERLYDRMAFATYFSSSPDTRPATVTHVDGVLNGTVRRPATAPEAAGLGSLKVEASDDSGIIRVVAAYTNGQGVWRSQDLAYDEAMYKWTGVISATVETQYFVQVVDGAGNVAIDDDKGQYHRFLPPVPLIVGKNPHNIYLPIVKKGGR
jgi:hypothetical protein